MKVDPKIWLKAEEQRREIMAKYARDHDAADACARLRRTAEKAPGMTAVLADLVACAGRACEYDVAAAAARKLISAAPENPATVERAAEALITTGCAAEAVRAWQRVTRSASHKAAGWTFLSRMAERRNDLPETARCLAEAVAAAPGDPSVILALAQLDRREGRLDEAQRRLQPLAAPAVPAALRFRALYELGEIHDRQDDRAAAVQAWRSAKRAVEEAQPGLVSACRQLRTGLLARRARIRENLDAATLTAWLAEPPATDIPPVTLLAGHPRSGTTLLEQMLAAHPLVTDIDEQDALGCAVRETLFRPAPGRSELDSLRLASPALLTAARRDYRRRVQMLATLPKGGHILDKNPNLTDFIPFLLRPFPGLRLLVARRDPRDIALSCFRQPVLPDYANIAWLNPAETAFDCADLLASWEHLRDKMGDTGRWMEISYEALCAGPEATARAATAFMGLDWHPAQEAWRERSRPRPVASPTYADVAAPVHTRAIGGWERYADLLPELFAPWTAQRPSAPPKMSAPSPAPVPGPAVTAATPLREVLVLGSGSAGLLAALSLKLKLPALNVRILRSPGLGIIGVGEGTTPNFPTHLLSWLGIDSRRVYRGAEPVWKLGIKFLWGSRSHFNYTFAPQASWKLPGENISTGFYCQEDMRHSSLESTFMDTGRVFSRAKNGHPVVPGNIAFHLENKKLAGWLEEEAVAAGITLTDGTVERITRHPDGRLAALHTAEGATESADFFIDCSGFRSELLGGALHEPFDSFADTLFCDRAVVGGWQRGPGEPIQAYTVAETMNHGWAWRIDHEHHINRGYVYSSACVDDAAAEAEFRAANPKVGQTRIVPFRSGSYRRAWRHNVVAIGNSCSFVEPLEATALMAICIQCQMLVQSLADSLLSPGENTARHYNAVASFMSAEIRDFLAVHYKFNTRLDTPYWRQCRADTPLREAQPIIDFYLAHGPSGLMDQVMPRNSMFGHPGYLALLVGQQVPHRGPVPPPGFTSPAWEAHCRQCESAAATAFTAEEALPLFKSM